MRASSLLVFTTALSFAAAQFRRDDPLDQFLSEAYSVYTQVTSIIGSAASAASVAATASSSAIAVSSPTSASSTSSEARTSESSYTESSSSTSTSEQTSIPSSSSSIELSAASSASSGSSQSSTASSSDQTTLASSSFSSRTSSLLGTTSILGAAAESGTSIPSLGSNGGNGGHKLAIILGCVFGTLALGLFILALVLCCKRRRHGSNSPRHRALSPGDEEVDSWRVGRPSGSTRSRNTSSRALVVPGAAPLMSEHPAFRNQPEHENPFVPVPPPPRRTAPNSRAGLTDGMVPGDNPFLEKEISIGRSPNSSRGRDSSHNRDTLTSGLTGAAIGAGLVNNNKGQDDEKTLVADEPAYPVDEPQTKPMSLPQPRINRKPVPAHHVNNSEPWPYTSVSPIDPAAEVAALSNIPTRSGEESRRGSRDAARANAAFDKEYSPQDDRVNNGSRSPQGRGHGQALATAAAGLTAAGVGGVAIAHHHDDRRSRSSSNSSGRRQSDDHTQSPSPRRRPLATQNPASDLSNSSSDSNNSYNYSDALATQPNFAQQPKANPPIASPPAQPQPYSRPDPYEVPPAPPARSRRNSALGTAAPAAAAYSYINRPAVPSPLSTEIKPDYSFSPPRIPNRSPRRSSRGSGSQDSTPYDVYSSNPWVANDDDDYTETSNLRGDKGIVGDNGYPHMDVPRRRSGVEDSFDAPGPLEPQSIVPPPASRVHEAGTRMARMGSDDSTWRMSSGMPGGWMRGNGEYSRLSGDYQKPGRLRASDLRGHEPVDRRYYQGVGQAI